MTQSKENTSKMYFTILIVSLFHISYLPLTIADCTTYSYVNGQDGPNDWSTSCPDFCSKNAQSPIDFDPSTISVVKNWLPFQLIHYEVDPYKMKITNTGHTVKVTFEPDDCHHIPTVIQGNLPGQAYQLAQFHFHWGSSGQPGSEHTYKGKQYDGEIHFVHYNIECGDSLTQAIANCKGPEAVAVLGVWIEAGGRDNHDFKSIIDGLQTITTKGDVVEIKPMDMTKLMPHNLDEFYRYDGGLTTPACNEIVTWTVFKEYVKISKRQLEEFFKLTTTDGVAAPSTAPIPLINTFRSVQPLNGRPVYYADLQLRSHHDDWEIAPYCGIYYKETEEELDFLSAIDHCTSYYWSKTPMEGLIPVRKLRCLRNRFQSMSTDDIDGRFFRVNAIKDNKGVWREFNSNHRILFHQFPEFDLNHGSSGDTLVWDAFLNRLFIQNQGDKYKAMCYRDYMNGCEDCPGSDNENVCSNAGECIEDVCQCDGKFSWEGCQLGPGVPGQEVVIIGNSGPLKKTQMFYSGVANQVKTVDSDVVCEITNSNYADISSTTHDQVCDYVFGRGICCLGLLDPQNGVDTCFYWDCFTQSWIATSNVPAKLVFAAANPIRQEGRDKYWIIAGGKVDSDTGTANQAVYAMDSNMVWTEMAQLPWARTEHCQIQISDCEVAFIGGTKTTPGGTDSVTKDIDIWNFKTNKWRSGPQLNTAINKVGCGLINDRHDYAKKVVVCGTPTDKVEVWDIANCLVYKTTHDCPSTGYGNFKELDNNYHDHEDFNTNQLVFTNSQSEVYIFDLYNGFKQSYTIAESTGGNAFVAPRGTIAAGTAACTA